jgi:hypothetical protein
VGFIHSKLRSRLGASTVDKLVYVKWNYPATSNHAVLSEDDMSPDQDKDQEDLDDE